MYFTVHIDGLCRAHSTHPSGATAGMDRQGYSLSKASQLVQQCENRLSAKDSAPHGDRLFHMVGDQSSNWQALSWNGSGLP